MAFINPSNEYPRFIGDIQLAHPDYSEGDVLPEGWHEVTPTEMPKQGPDELVSEGNPIFENGAWVQTWKKRNLTAEEIERREAPKTARAKLATLGLTELEIDALVRGLR